MPQRVLGKVLINKTFGYLSIRRGGEKSSDISKSLILRQLAEIGAHKTSHSGFVYYRYFPRKEKVGGKRGLKLRLL